MAIVAATNTQSPLCTIAQCLGDVVYRVSLRFQTIWEQIQPYVKQVVDACMQFECARRGGGRPKPSVQPKNRPPLTPDQRQIWDLLSGRVMSGKEIANTIGRDLCSEDAVRQRIRRMVGNGWQIKNTRGSGYWRPVAPPHGLATG